MPIRYLSGLSVDSTVLVVDAANDRVGIGTASPLRTLHINGETVFEGGDANNKLYRFIGRAGNYAQFQILNDAISAETTVWSIYRSGQTVTSFNIENGNVGIGTTSPTSLLSVQGNTDLGNSYGNTTSSLSTTRISGFALYQDASNRHGNYGVLILNSDTGWTASARRFMITNGLGSNKFAIIRSVDASTDPALGTAGSVASGTVDFEINNAGAATFSSSVTATSFIKTSGTSAQFLKADGSVDSSTYLTANQTITLSGVVTGSGTTAITTAIANGAITNAMLANSSFFVGTTSIDLGRASAAQTLTGVSIDGNAATATEVSRTVTAGTEANLVSATIGDNDFFRIRTGGASNAGFVEIATADDGTEPIYVRQYTGVFATLTRTATLLDGSGNTSFPGSVTASSLIKSGGTSAQYLMADGSVSTLTNPVTGTGTTNYVTKWTSGSAIGDSIIYDNGTNLGIGTTTPYGGTGVRSITVNAASYPTLALKVGDVFKGGIFGYSDHIDLYSEGYLNFETSGTEKMRIDTSGNVGIGITNPGTKLDIGFDTNNRSLVRLNSNAANRMAAITFYGNNLESGTIGYEGGSEIVSGGVQGDLVIRNHLASKNIILITNAGNVGIGTTSPGIGDGTYVAPLTISSASTLGTFLAIKNTQATYGMGGVWMQANTGNAGWLFGTDNDGKGVLHYGSGASENDALTDAKDGTKGITIDTSGNVGIGTTSPNAPLHIVKDLGTSVSAVLRLRGSNSTARTTRLQFEDYNGTIADGLIDFIVPTAGSSTGARLDIGVDSAVMSLVKGGNVGIGTTAPGEILEASRSTNGDIAIKVTNSNTGSSAAAQFFASNGTNQTQFFHTGTSYTGSGVLTSAAGLGGLYNATVQGLAFLAANASGAIKFATGTGNDERMRITAAGNVGIDTTSPLTKLSVHKTTAFSTSSPQAGEDNIFLTSATAAGSGVFGASIGFSRNGFHDRRAAAIASVQGTADEDQIGLAFFTHPTIGGADAIAEAMRISYDGNVGIGTTGPAQKLDVEGSVRATGGGFEPSTSAWINAAFTTKINGSPYGGGLALIDGTTGWAQYTIGSGANLVFAYGATSGATSEKMRITSAGNVGIGTTAPASILHVSSTGANAYSSTITKGSNMKGIVNTSSNNANDMIGIYFATGNAEGAHWSGITGSRSNAPTDWGTQLNFYTHDENLSNINDATQKMVIKGSGNVGIGTTSPAANAKLTIDGSAGANTSQIDMVGYSSTAKGHLGQFANGIYLSTNYYYSGGQYNDTATLGQAAIVLYAGSTTASYIDFNLSDAGANSPNVKVRILSNGNVGIGTTSPEGMLTIGTTNPTINLGDTGVSVTDALIGRAAANDYHVTGSAAGDLTIRPEATKKIVFGTTSTAATTGVARMTIDTSGNVGIGTTAPVTPLQVVSDTNDVDVLRIGNTAGNSGSVQGFTHLAINHFNAGTFPSTRITAYQDGVSGWPGGMYFSTREVNTDSAPLERLRITSAGSIGINTTNPTSRLEVVGDARITTGSLGVGVAPNATDGRIDASNDIVAFSTSDRRLKENITPIANALEKVRSLTGVEFDWKEETKSVHGYEGHDVGVIAQDVQAVLPEAVRTNDSGYLSVRYEKMIALLVEAMKEQQAQIEELKKLIK